VAKAMADPEVRVKCNGQHMTREMSS
jgi:hypothetical protein